MSNLVVRGYGFRRTGIVNRPNVELRQPLEVVVCPEKFEPTCVTIEPVICAEVEVDGEVDSVVCGGVDSPSMDGVVSTVTIEGIVGCESED